jgi:hypothetical protein
MLFPAAALQVTWKPFEAYVEYAGQYKLTRAGGLQIDVHHINHIPKELDLEGRYRIDDEGCLILPNIRLGLPQGYVPIADGSSIRCRHGFAPR